MLNRILALFNEPRVEISDEHHRIFNYAKYLRGFRRKRALLSYLPVPVAADLRNEPTSRFSNEGIARAWPRVLNELGYSVDIINWDDVQFQAECDYDLVVLHGGRNFKQVYEPLKNKPALIHFLTGTYWHTNNANEDQRRQDFAKRHGVTAPRDRYISADEDIVNEAARGIIILGDESIRRTYDKYPVVEKLNNASYPDDHFDRLEKDYTSARKNFLFFAGAGNIHKGLDLTIEAFGNLTDEHLYIMTVPDQVVTSTLADDLKRPNIHMIGEVPMRTPEFYDVVAKCAYLILPSCGEGQPGTVVEGMHQGLIPIVTRESGFSAEAYGGHILKDATIETIQKAVTTLSSLPASSVEQTARGVRQAAEREYTPKQFRKNLKESIIHIVGT